MSRDASPDSSRELPISAADTAPESRHVKTHVLRPTVPTTTTGDFGIGLGLKDGALLSEVRDSIRTISSGVEELATTVQDLLGLSDSDHASENEYDADDGGKITWATLRSHARRRRRARRQSKLESAVDTDGTTDSGSDNNEDDNGPQEVIPEVRECNLVQFQSKPVGCGHKRHCVDILVAGDSLDDEILDFRATTADLQAGSIERWHPEHASGRAEDSTSENTGKKWIRRIRINSRAVLETLRYVCPRLWGNRHRPTVFRRPFQLLVSLQKEVKEQLENIKGLVSGGPTSDGTDSTASIKPGSPGMTRPPGLHDLLQKLGHGKNAVDELTCFVDFMESRIMPDARRFRDPSSSPPETIRWEDLWYLFKPGDLIYVNLDPSGTEPIRSNVSAQRFFRVIDTCLTDTSAARPPVGQRVLQRFSVLGHFIEYDGASYVPMHYIFRPIFSFRGQKSVTELPIYPVSYLEDDQVLAQAQSDGATYVNLIEKRSGYYSGWSQTVSPYGVRLREPLGSRLASPEHIESDILVDFEETFNAFPGWRPTPYQGTADMVEGHQPISFRLVKSDLSLLEWDEMGRASFGGFDKELRVDGTEVVESSRFIVEDALGQFRSDKRRAPTGKYLALLPRCFYAYAVLERKFVQLNTRFVRSADLEANDKAFDKLEIDRNYKRLILALVKSHFDKIETEKRRNVEIDTQDLIRGKGKGVVILLHGVPGVGKTATAEAVALKWKKPLFPITCGDLGYTAETLEKSLNEIFRLAHHWGCILLLDEADVFITQRERHDLKRNALVSAFLRVLEYYNGIMFLTTNRTGVLDEAVKSRVHLNLHYDHLTEEQTVAIFKQHIQRLRDIERQRNTDESEQIMVLHKEIIQFARDHFNQRVKGHGSGSNFGRWNGRQIRNAFLIASSLAHYDDEDEAGDGDQDSDELAEPGRKKQKQLGRSQFEVVAQTTLMYDQYRESVHSGKSDEHVAFEREERAMSAQPRPSTPVRMNEPTRSFG